jgi:hypothetical protein
MNIRVDSGAVADHASEDRAVHGTGRRMPREGDVIASRRTARADLYAISIVPLTAHTMTRRYTEAVQAVRALARGLHVDGWFTCDHTHFTRIVAFRQ